MSRQKHRRNIQILHAIANQDAEHVFDRGRIVERNGLLAAFATDRDESYSW